ncbi:unnamed protein product, partial [Durusdinium trenchii]
VFKGLSWRALVPMVPSCCDAGTTPSRRRIFADRFLRDVAGSETCRLVQSSRLMTPTWKEDPRPVRGAKALKQLSNLAESKTCCSSPDRKHLGQDQEVADAETETGLLQEVLEVAETWPVDEDGVVPDLDPGSAGVNLGLDAKDRFYGRMSGVEVEKELIRLAVLLQSLLRDFSIMKDTMGHLEDEQNTVKETVRHGLHECSAQVLDVQKDSESRMKVLTTQVEEATWTVARCQFDTKAKTQALGKDLQEQIELQKQYIEEFKEDTRKRSKSLEDVQQRVMERIECNEQARKALRIDAFGEMARERKAAQDLRAHDQEEINQKFAELQLIQQSSQEASRNVREKIDFALEVMNQVQEKIDIVAEENVSKFVLTDNVVAQLQEKVKHVSEETVQRRLSTQAVIEELRKELHWRKASSGKTSSGNAGSYRVDSLLTSEFSREDSQGGQFLREDSQIQGSQGSELQITQSSQSGELLERIEILELQVQRATEDHKGLEDDIFNRLKDLELQVQRGVENTSYLEEDFADRCKEIDAQVHLAATSQRDLAEDVFQRIEDLEDQVRRKGERQEQMDLHLRDLQDMVESRSERRPAEEESSSERGAHSSAEDENGRLAAGGAAASEEEEASIHRAVGEEEGEEETPVNDPSIEDMDDRPSIGSAPEDPPSQRRGTSQEGEEETPVNDPSIEDLDDRPSSGSAPEDPLSQRRGTSQEPSIVVVSPKAHPA